MRPFAFALLLTVAAPVAAFAAPTIGNSGFDNYDVTGKGPGGANYDYFIYDANNGNATVGWSFVGASGIAKSGSALDPQGAQSGTQVAFIQGSSSFGSNSFSQTITGLTVGHTYSVSFFDAMLSGSTAAPLSVTFDSTQLGTFTPTSTTFAQQLTSAIYTATATSGVLSFSGGTTNGTTVLIDTVAIADTTAVPEPASLLLLVGGLAGVGLVRRASRQRIA